MHGGSNLRRGLAGIGTTLVVILTLLAGILLGLADAPPDQPAVQPPGSAPTAGRASNSLQGQVMITLPAPAETPSQTPRTAPPPTATRTQSYSLLPAQARCIPPAGWQAQPLEVDVSLFSLAIREGLSIEMLQLASCIAAHVPLDQDTLYLPAAAPPTPPPCQVPQNWVLYTIQEGDTLFSLARSRGSTVYEVLQANCRTATWIETGTGLYLPPGAPQPAVTTAPGPEQSATSAPAGQIASQPILESPIHLNCETNATYQRFSWTHPLPLPEGWNFEVRTFDVRGQYKSLRTREELSLAGLPWLVYLDRADENWQQPYWELAILDENGKTQVVSRYTPFLNCP